MKNQRNQARYLFSLILALIGFSIWTTLPFHSAVQAAHADNRARDIKHAAETASKLAANGKIVHRGTVIRLLLIIPAGRRPFILRSDTIGSGFAQHLDPAALVIGPTGVGLARNGTLYVADTVANRIAAIPDALFRVTDAGPGFTVSQGHALMGELGLVVAPGGDILTVNGGNGNLVEVSPSGMQVAVRALDVSGSPPGAGALFGLAVKPHHRAVYFVDDATNTFELLH